MSLPKFPVKNWEKLPLEVYQETLKEAKEHFEEFSLETESVTDKAYKILWFFTTFISGAGAIILSKPNRNLLTDTILVILFLILFYKLYDIIKARDTVYRGVNPKDHITNDYDREDLSDLEKQRLLYTNLIEQYMGMIAKIKCVNNKRAQKYNIVLRLSIILLISTSLYIGYIF